jgi:hypothetical protein
MAVALLFMLVLIWKIYPGNSFGRYAGILLSVGAYGAILFAIWTPVSVDPLLTYDEADYGAIDIYGIKWQKSYEAVFLNIPNDGADVTNVNIYLMVDAQIQTAGSSKGINSCTWEHWQPKSLFVGPALFKVTNIEGRSEIPLQQDKWTSPFYHIRCERLSGGSSQIEFIFAITPKISPESHGKNNIEKAKPRWAKLWISLMSGYRPVKWSVDKCFINGQCKDIPEVLPGTSS